MKLIKNNDFFFDSIMSVRYLRPKLIDNEFLNKLKKQNIERVGLNEPLAFEPKAKLSLEPIITKPLDIIVENESNKIFILEKQEKWYKKYGDKIYCFLCDNFKIIILLILLIVFLYYRYKIFRSKTNDEILIDNIRRENKKKELLRKKLLLEKLLNENNHEVYNNNNVINENNIRLNKNIDNELNIYNNNQSNQQNNIIIPQEQSILAINEMRNRRDMNNHSIDNYLASTNLMAHNDINGNYDYI